MPATQLPKYNDFARVLRELYGLYKFKDNLVGREECVSQLKLSMPRLKINGHIVNNWLRGYALPDPDSMMALIMQDREQEHTGILVKLRHRYLQASRDIVFPTVDQVYAITPKRKESPPKVHEEPRDEFVRIFRPDLDVTYFVSPREAPLHTKKTKISGKEMRAAKLKVTSGLCHLITDCGCDGVTDHGKQAIADALKPYMEAVAPYQEMKRVAQGVERIDELFSGKHVVTQEEMEAILNFATDKKMDIDRIVALERQFWDAEKAAGKTQRA